MIKEVKPKKVYLFAIDPELDQLEEFFNRLIGLLNNIISRSSGRGDLSRIAAAMAHREVTILKGIEFLQSRGIFYTNLLEGGEIIVKPGGRIVLDESRGILEQLKYLLAETAAFRAYYRKADKNMVMKNYT